MATSLNNWKIVEGVNFRVDKENGELMELWEALIIKSIFIKGCVSLCFFQFLYMLFWKFITEIIEIIHWRYWSIFTSNFYSVVSIYY